MLRVVANCLYNKNIEDPLDSYAVLKQFLGPTNPYPYQIVGLSIQQGSPSTFLELLSTNPTLLYNTQQTWTLKVLLTSSFTSSTLTNTLSLRGYSRVRKGKANLISKATIARSFADLADTIALLKQALKEENNKTTLIEASLKEEKEKSRLLEVRVSNLEFNDRFYQYLLLLSFTLTNSLQLDKYLIEEGSEEETQR